MEAQVLEQFKYYHKKYEQHLPAIFFIAGFLFDILTLGEIDDLSNIISQAFYLIASAGILAVEFIGVEKIEYQNKFLEKVFLYREDIFHFLLGSLLSAFTLFYFKSASVSNSFLFLSLLVALLVLNETELFQKRGLIVRSALFKLCLLSYFIYLLPVLVGKSGMGYFFLSSAISLTLSLLGFFYFVKNSRQGLNFYRVVVVPHIAIVFTFTVLYALKAVPPVPLAIKEIGIYRKVDKKNGGYQTSQLTSKWKFWSNGDQNFDYRPGDRVFVFTKIFSPAGFEGKVFIRWSKYIDGEFKTSDRIPLKVTGGRRAGFRGFAYKKNISPGEWRIKVETSDGLEIGRIDFDVEKDEEKGPRKFVVTSQ